MARRALPQLIAMAVGILAANLVPDEDGPAIEPDIRETFALDGLSL